MVWVRRTSAYVYNMSLLVFVRCGFTLLSLNFIFTLYWAVYLYYIVCGVCCCKAITLRCRRCNKPVKASKTYYNGKPICVPTYKNNILWVYVYNRYLLIVYTDDLLPNEHGKYKRNKYLKRIIPMYLHGYTCIGLSK